ncbi:MAG: hypothetical protein ISS15_09360 [Alphaproteobacteria bacterium]|nr:hypothetical protein [Alphaproteobacteria bacterium]MBL6938790.1 hypothetical protein [Alphaproteobacteria bacterium]MBL7097853.1 hypothetical protein [Alphaproteobacteria bacterium]
MSRVVHWDLVLACLLGGSLCMPSGALAEKTKVVSGLVGAQDTQSKEWLALSPTEADQVVIQHLLSLLKPVGKFTQDKSHNVEATTFVTQPYSTTYPYVCRQDRVTLQYQYQGKFDATGKWLDDERRPVGVEAQATFHIAQLPVPGFIPGTSYPVTACDASHPGAAARWIAAPHVTDAILAANLFRMAEDNVRAGGLVPTLCDKHGTLTCREWLLSLDDLSKMDSVEQCSASSSDSVCYVLSFDSVDVTIIGKISRDDVERITPAAITSVRIDNVITLME